MTHGQSHQVNFRLCNSKHINGNWVGINTVILVLWKLNKLGWPQHTASHSLLNVHCCVVHVELSLKYEICQKTRKSPSHLVYAAAFPCASIRQYTLRWFLFHLLLLSFFLLLTGSQLTFILKMFVVWITRLSFWTSVKIGVGAQEQNYSRVAKWIIVPVPGCLLEHCLSKQLVKFTFKSSVVMFQLKQFKTMLCKHFAKLFKCIRGS